MRNRTHDLNGSSQEEVVQLPHDCDRDVTSMPLQRKGLV